MGIPMEAQDFPCPCESMKMGPTFPGCLELELLGIVKRFFAKTTPGKKQPGNAANFSGKSSFKKPPPDP